MPVRSQLATESLAARASADAAATTNSGIASDGSVDTTHDATASNNGDGGPLAADASVDAPHATSACGTDLDIHNGTVKPDFGTPLKGSPAPAVPSDTGPSTVTTQTLSVPVHAATVSAAGMDITITDGTLPATAYVPSGKGPFPLVIVLAGFQTSYTSYEDFSRHFASHGMLVVGVDTRSNALMASHDKEAVEVTQTIDYVLSADSKLASLADATKIAVAGHSKGGKVAFFTSAIDPRVDLVIGWDPVNAGGGPCAFDANCNAMPVAPNCTVMKSGVEQYMHAESLVIGAPPDANLNPEPTHNAENFYRGAPSHAWYARLNAGHIDWVPTLTGKPDVVRITKAAQIALLLQRFYGVAGLEKYLPGGSTLASEALLVTAHAK